MEKSDKIKLDLVRLDGIRNLIISKISEENLKIICKKEFKLDSKNYFESLKKFNRTQLIKIIENCKSINSKDIDETYEQYRYGLKPGFTIFNIIKPNFKDIDLNNFDNLIKGMLNNFEYLDEARFKNLRFKSILEIQQNTFEFSFDYLSKYTYISEDEEPQSIYELKDCFVWINIKNNFVAIKNCPNDIQNKLLRCFSELLQTPLYNIMISKKLISKVFNGSVKKGTFVKPDANEDEVSKITIADAELSKKKIYNDVSSYDMSNTFLDEKLDDNTNSTLGINCKAGKIYLTKNVNATQFRNWSISSINKITSYLNDIHNCQEVDIFKSRNILANTNYKGEVRNIVEEICYRVFMYINNEETPLALNNDVIKIYNTLKDKFYYSLFGYCDSCNEETQLFCGKCTKSDLKIVNDKIFCLECGEIINNICCDEGHNIYNLELIKVIRLIPKKEFIDEINDLLFNNFSFRLDASFTIEGNHLNIHKYSSSEILDYSLVNEFDELSKTVVGDIEKTLNSYEKIKEKCKKCSNNSCSICDKTQDKCIMKLFLGFGDYRPSPHQGQEFGDVNFKITYKEGKVYNFVGIAKSRPKTGILNLSSKEGRELLQQIFTMTRDKRVDVIGAICPAKFHDQLRQELYYVAKVTNTKLMILDDIFMSKLLIYKNKR